MRDMTLEERVAAINETLHAQMTQTGDSFITKYMSDEDRLAYRQSEVKVSLPGATFTLENIIEAEKAAYDMQLRLARMGGKLREARLALQKES